MFYKCLVDTGKELIWIEVPKIDWPDYRRYITPNHKIPSLKTALEVIEKIKYEYETQD